MPQYKQILLLWKKPELSNSMFQSYYDNEHLKVVSSVLSPPLRKHERNYPLWDDPLTSGPELTREFHDFSVLSSIVFDDPSVREAWYAILTTNKDARDAVAADEQKFIVPDRRMLFVADEVSHAVKSSAAPKIHVVRFLSPAAGLSATEFKSEYENDIRHNLDTVPPGITTYRRNYLLKDHPWSVVPQSLTGKSDSIELIEELSFENREAADLAIQTLNEVGAAFKSINQAQVRTVCVRPSKALPKAWVNS